MVVLLGRGNMELLMSLLCKLPLQPGFPFDTQMNPFHLKGAPFLVLGPHYTGLALCGCVSWRHVPGEPQAYSCQLDSCSNLVLFLSAFF